MYPLHFWETDRVHVFEIREMDRYTVLRSKKWIGTQFWDPRNGSVHSFEIQELERVHVFEIQLLLENFSFYQFSPNIQLWIFLVVLYFYNQWAKLRNISDFTSTWQNPFKMGHCNKHFYDVPQSWPFRNNQFWSCLQSSTPFSFIGLISEYPQWNLRGNLADVYCMVCIALVHR